MSRDHERTASTESDGIEYLDGLYSYAMVLTQDSTESEDIVLNTYISAMLTRGNPRVAATVKYVFFMTLRNIWFNRKTWHDASQEIEIEVDDARSCNVAMSPKNSQDLDMNMIDEEQARATIQELPIQFREIILLREYERFSYQEVANITGCPVASVGCRLLRARASLSHCFLQRRA